MVANAPILIAGGGIGGLALALALAKRGRRSLVLERQAEFSPAGAGIQIGPNGVRILRELGVAGALEPFAGKPETIEVFDGNSGRKLTSLPLGNWLEARHGAPYWVAHRGDLHRALLETAALSSLIEVRTGFEVGAIEQSDDEVSVKSQSGEALSGSLLAGADGLWSTVRESVAPGIEPSFAGATAGPAPLSPRAKPGLLPSLRWAYGSAPRPMWCTIRCVAARKLPSSPSCRSPGNPVPGTARSDWAMLSPSLSHFHAPLVQPLHAAARAVTWRKWALHVLPPLASWASGRAVLLGDAAHPMLPYLAQGGACAMEDAVVLAGTLAGHGAVPDGAIPRAVARYVSLRRERAARVQRASLRQGMLYRLSAPLGHVRNAVFRAVPAPWLMSRLDWLYGWRPPDER